MVNKEEERGRILRLLYKGGGLSRKEINSSLKIRPTTLQEIISSMLAEGLLHEPDRISRKTGARSPRLYINPAFGNLLGIDIGSNLVKIIVTDFNGAPLHSVKGSYSPRKSRLEIFGEIFPLLESVKREKPLLWGKIRAAGVADPGPVDPENGVSLFAFNIRDWENVPTADVFRDRLGLPVTLLTASHTKAVHEWFYSAEPLKSLFVVDMGHGVGAAFIHGGGLFLGHTHTEMEFGHIIVNRGGRQCVCGKNGCLEAEAGSAAVLDKLKRKLSDGARSALEMKGGPEEIKISDVYAAALTGDPVALSLAHETAEYLAGGLSCVIQLLNPQKIIIHGPVTALGDKLTDLVRHCLYKYSFPSAVDKTEICLSEADEFSAASGACLAARETVLFGSGNCPGVLFDKIRRDSAGVSRGGA